MNVLLYGCDLISNRTKSGFIWFVVTKSTAPFPGLRGAFPHLTYLSGPQYLTLTVVSAFSYLYSETALENPQLQPAMHPARLQADACNTL